MQSDLPLSHADPVLSKTVAGAPRLARQALGYLVVGGLAAVVDIGLFHLLAPGFQGVLLPAAASFSVAAIVNYALSSLWVYRRQWRSLRRATLFLLFASIGLCINAGVTWWLHSIKPADDLEVSRAAVDAGPPGP